MKPPTKTIRPTGVSGVKALITAAAFAATLAGWATLSTQVPPTVDTTGTAIAAAPTISIAAAAPPAWLLSPPNIPTLLLVATAQAAPNLPAAAAAPAVVDAAPKQPVAASVALIAAPPLREVAAAPVIIASAPVAPRPVTRTRSSR